MSGSVPLPRALLDALYAHAEEGYPDEVCGLVFSGHGDGYPEPESVRCENRQNALHAEDPATFTRDAKTAYNFGARDLLKLDKSLRTERPARIIYHSHVEVGAYFSDEDVRAAAPDGELLYPCDYLVVDVKKDGAKGARLFRFESSAFVEVGRDER